MKRLTFIPPLIMHLSFFILMAAMIHGCDYGQSNTKHHINGIDVSHYQGTINWNTVANDNVKFAIAKATGGDDYTDPMFNVNWQGMRENELVRGAYHFYYPNIDPIAQAKYYLKTVNGFLQKDLPPILDIEVTEGQDASSIVKGALRWIKKVESVTKRRPIIYSDNAFLSEYLNHPELAQYPLWVADYSDEVAPLPSYWKKPGWLMWQHSDSGQLEGISTNVDLDKFSGSLRQLRHFVKHSHL